MIFAWLTSLRQPVRRPLLATGLLWSVCLALPDLFSHWAVLQDMGLVGVSAYLAGLSGSLCLWLTIVAILSAFARWPKIRVLLAVGLGVWLGLVVVLCVSFQYKFHDDLPPSYFTFGLHNRRYGLSLVLTGLGRRTRIACIAWPLLISTGLLLLSRAKPALAIAFWQKALGAAFAIAAAVAVPTLPLPADLHALRVTVLGSLALTQPESRLPAPDRTAISATPAAKYRPDIVLFIHESVSAEEWAPWNPASSVSPGLQAFFRDHPDQAVYFPDAKPSAGATDVSVPSLLSGLPPDATLRAFSQAPLLWHEAKALGYRTAFLSSQMFDWQHMREFLVGSDAPDLAKVSSDFVGAAAVNDRGVDDALVVKAALGFIDNVPRQTPLLLVMQFNASHWPCWAPNLDVIVGQPTERPNSRREMADRYLDQLMTQTLAHLQSRGRLANALVVVTSDHGEVRRVNSPLRLESYYEDVLHVPLGIQLPADFARAEPRYFAQLAVNARQRVGNIDLYPTILDIWGRWDAVHGAGLYRPHMAGSSLLRPIDPDRLLIATNTGETRTWDRKKFALYHRQFKWLVDEHDGVQVFDLAVDPAELRPLAQLPEAERQFFAQAMVQHPFLAGALRKWNGELSWKRL